MAIDYDGLFGGDDYDPCEALKSLRPAYMKLLATGGVQRISFRDRTTTFHQADTKEMQALISQLESECAEKNGVKVKKRMAITAGSRVA